MIKEERNLQNLLNRGIFCMFIVAKVQVVQGGKQQTRRSDMQTGTR